MAGGKAIARALARSERAQVKAAPRVPTWVERAQDRAAIKITDAAGAADESLAKVNEVLGGRGVPGVPVASDVSYPLAAGRGRLDVSGANFGGWKDVTFDAIGPREQNKRVATDIFASARNRLREDMDSRPWWEPTKGYFFTPATRGHEKIYDRFVSSFDHPDYKAAKTWDGYELRRKFPLRHEVAAAATIGAPAAVLWPQDAEGGVSSPALGVPAVPGVPDSVGAAPASALARALARQLPEFNRAVDTSLDVASFFDPSMGYATETARALKDLPGKVGPAGAVALAPLTGATEALAGVGQLPELGVAGGRAIARALARAPQPRGSQTYRKRK